MELLSVTQISENLGKLSNWNLEDNGTSLIKNFEFKDFQESINFINKISHIAQQQEHHPEIKLYGGNNLEIKLTTAQAKGLTKKDFEIAFEIDKI